MWMLPLYLHVNQKSNDDDDSNCGLESLACGATEMDSTNSFIIQLFDDIDQGPVVQS